MLFPDLTQEMIDSAGDGNYLLKPGKVRGILGKCEEVPNKSAGGTQFSIMIDGEDEAGKRGKVFGYVSFSAKAPWILVNFAKSIGMEEALVRKELNALACVHKDIEVIIEHETYEGKTRNKIKSFVPRGDAKSTKELRQKEAMAATPGGFDDDLPF